MAHRTLIDGTAYEVSRGKTLVDGTAYSIKKGNTLVDGTAYEIGFKKMITLTVVKGADYALNPVDDSKLSYVLGYDFGTYEFLEGTEELHVDAYSPMGKSSACEISINGEVLYTQSPASTLSAHAYCMFVPYGNTTIELTTNNSEAGVVNITVDGEYEITGGQSWQQ